MYVTALGLLGELSPVKGVRTELVDDQATTDIISEVLAVHEDSTSEYDKIAKFFYNGTLPDLYVALFDYCKREMPYRVEPGADQTVREPAINIALGRVSGSDCKHYASFIAGVLDAVNRQFGTRIKWAFRFASYTLTDCEPGHVFVVVDPGTADETWIDPVLDVFDVHYPSPVYYTDKKPRMLSRLSGISYEYDDQIPLLPAVGAASGTAETTTGKIGTGLLAVAPALATVPVVGWVAGAAALVVGSLLKVFLGKKELESESVRDLVKHYRISVKGQDGGQKSNSKNVSPAEADECQAWFSIVLGVPIYDSERVIALCKMPASAAIAAFRQFPDIGKVDDSIIYQAHLIALSMDFYNINKGSLKNMCAARVQTELPVNPETLQGGGFNNPNSTINTMATNATAGGSSIMELAKANPMIAALVVGAAGWGVYEMSGSGKRKAVGKIDNTQILLIGGLGLAAVFAFKMMGNSSNNAAALLAAQQQSALQQMQNGGYAQQYAQQPSGNVWSTLTALIGGAGQYFGNR